MGIQWEAHTVAKSIALPNLVGYSPHCEFFYLYIKVNGVASQVFLRLLNIFRRPLSSSDSIIVSKETLNK